MNVSDPESGGERRGGGRGRRGDSREAPAAPERGELRASLAAARARLSPAQRRVAEVAARDPECVAFGTVAEVAARAGTSGASVVRLADRLGYAGFVGLQQAVRRDLRRRLRPAVERIRTDAGGGGGRSVLAHALEVEGANVRLSLEALDPHAFEGAVSRLSAARHRVTVIPSEQSHGVGAIFAGELGIVRDGVRLVEGSSFRVVSRLAALRPDDTVVLMDYRRHERGVVEANAQVAACGAARILLTDSELSPLAEGALAVLPVAAAGSGPFDSHVGMLAVANALVAAVAARRRRSVIRRLDALEEAWVSRGALVDD